jgi:hypothetical protein
MVIPNDSDSLASRGAWLGGALLKASRADLQMLIKLCEQPLLSKQVQNTIRMELTVFSLSKSSKIIEPLFKEHFVGFSTEAVSQIKRTFFDGAWKFLGLFLSRQELNDMTQIYTGYTNEKGNSTLLWKRLIALGMNIDVENMVRDLNNFEQTVLHETTLLTTLDSIGTSQDQIESEHNSFLKSIGR